MHRTLVLTLTIGATLLFSSARAADHQQRASHDDALRPPRAVHRIVADGVDSVGVYSSDTYTYFLRNTNSAGPADLAFMFGAPPVAALRITGDWDGDGIDTIGIYDINTSIFYLKNTNGPGPADLVYQFSAPGFLDIPVAGDWDGDGVDTVGLYRSPNGFFFLRNEHAPGPADFNVSFGPANQNYFPFAGDWDGDGVDTVGVYGPQGQVFLSNSLDGGAADIVYTFGDGAQRKTIAGDWNGDGIDTVGFYNQNDRVFFLRNSHSSGPADLAFGFGPFGVDPVAGDWDGL